MQYTNTDKTLLRGATQYTPCPADQMAFTAACGPKALTYTRCSHAARMDTILTHSCVLSLLIITDCKLKSSINDAQHFFVCSSLYRLHTRLTAHRPRGLLQTGRRGPGWGGRLNINGGFSVGRGASGLADLGRGGDGLSRRPSGVHADQQDGHSLEHGGDDAAGHHDVCTVGTNNRLPLGDVQYGEDIVCACVRGDVWVGSVGLEEVGKDLRKRWSLEEWRRA